MFPIGNSPLERVHCLLSSVAISAAISEPKLEDTRHGYLSRHQTWVPNFFPLRILLTYST